MVCVPLLHEIMFPLSLARIIASLADSTTERNFISDSRSVSSTRLRSVMSSPVPRTPTCFFSLLISGLQELKYHFVCPSLVAIQSSSPERLLPWNRFSHSCLILDSLFG